MSNDFQFLDTKRQNPLKIGLDRRVKEFVEIYEPFPKASVQVQADRCLDCGDPYCSWKCPVHNYIPQWLDLVHQGKIMEAADLCHQTNTLPEVCGRVCPQDRLCEGDCTLNDGLGAVTIGNVEKYIADTAIAQGWKPDLSKVKSQPERVAVIGAGPAGLGCADVLARQGLQSVVFDRHPRIGGLLTFGIPTFKLEKEVMQKRKEIFEGMGITFELNVEVGKDIAFNSIMDEFDAVFLGTGAYHSMLGNIDGEKLPGSYQALGYLIGSTDHILGIKRENYPYVDLKGKQVVVLGGGDTAMDCVRTAVRQGATKVTCVYRRDKENMPGSRREVNNSQEEGVEFLFNCQPTRILGDDSVKGVQVMSTQLGKPDESGRAHPEIIKGSEQDLKADAVIFAFGFRPSPPAWLKDFGVDINSWQAVVASENSSYVLQTSNEKIFSGGDMVKGSDLVVTAIWQGREAAKGIVKYLHDKR